MANEPSDPHDPVPADNGRESFAAFLADLRKRHASGRAARNAVIARLARMTPAELATLPPSIVGRLGPKGLAELARRSTALQALVVGMMSPQPETEVPEPVALETVQGQSLFRRLQQRQPLPWQAAKSCATATVIGMLMLWGAPVAWRLIHADKASDGSALCAQLDWATGDCHYVTRSNALSIDRAAQMLGLDRDQLALANPRLPWTVSLDPGTVLLIPRRPLLNLR